ncbi:MAG: hypothetical protein K5768_05535 [Firmicutes bacterium]|nr:hypothetical protein [Bacillota bacterium]
MIIGMELNHFWVFPYSVFFCINFTIILSICIFTLKKITKSLSEIVIDIGFYSKTIKANYIYEKYCKNSILNFIIPLAVVLIFGIGGCLMFGGIKLTPSLIWFLTYFCITVYFSIVIYLQYIYLAVYIFMLSKSDGYYKGNNKSIIDYTPANIGWVKDLTKLSHLSRNAFFTVGSLYIISFGGFCFLPGTAADIKSIEFYLLWSIIFLAIVVVFPAISVLEIIWIKKIVNCLKLSLINDLYTEQHLFNMADKYGLISSLKNLTATISSVQIMNSKDYPISSGWGMCYSLILTVFNLIASIATILQYITPYQGGFLHIF